MLQRESSRTCRTAHGKSLRSIFLAAIAATLLFACQKKDDSDPEFVSIKLNQSALSDSTQVQAGASITIEVECEDDEGLNQLRIGVDPAQTANYGAWQDFYVGELSGTSTTITKVFHIPDTIEGHWHLDFDLIDDSGNLAETRSTVLQVSNDLLPEITINTINGEAFDLTGMQVNANSTIDFEGSISDPDGLELVRLRIYENSDEVLSEEWLLPDNPVSWSMSQIVLTAPDSAITWTTEIEAYDVGGYHYLVSFPILSQ